MNNKGFAVSTILYTILICFMLFLAAAMAMFSSANSLSVAANDDLINGSKFKATPIRLLGVGNPIDNVKIKVNSKYGVAYWPKDFVIISDNTKDCKYKNISTMCDMNASTVEFTDNGSGDKISCKKQYDGSYSCKNNTNDIVDIDWDNNSSDNNQVASSTDTGEDNGGSSDEEDTNRVTGISITLPTNTIIAGGEITPLVTITPNNAGSMDYKLETNNPIATVSGTKIVTSRFSGSPDIIVNITAISTTNPNIKATTSLTITSAPVSIGSFTISPDSLQLAVGQESTLTINTKPSNASIDRIEWHSSKPSSVTVDSNGKVKLIKPEEATIIVTVFDKNGGNAVSSIVVKPYDPPKLNKFGYVFYNNNTSKDAVTLKLNINNINKSDGSNIKVCLNSNKYSVHTNKNLTNNIKCNVPDAEGKVSFYYSQGNGDSGTLSLDFYLSNKYGRTTHYRKTVYSRVCSITWFFAYIPETSINFSGGGSNCNSAKAQKTYTGLIPDFVEYDVSIP